MDKYRRSFKLKYERRKAQETTLLPIIISGKPPKFCVSNFNTRQLYNRDNTGITVQQFIILRGTMINWKESRTMASLMKVG